MLLKSTSGANFLLRACTFKISVRAFLSGLATCICLSKRPGRNNAGSKTSARFVAAKMIIPSLPLNPSISTNNWLSVCSRSSCPPPIPVPL